MLTPYRRVGGVHRALLVGHDDELGPVGVAADELEEAVDVHVVERRLDLVEDVEGARPGEEHGEHERQRHQRLLAAREQRQPLRGLAGRRDLDLDAVVGPLVLLLRLLGAASAAGASSSARPARRRRPAAGRSGLTSRSRPAPPGNRCATTSSKFFAAASKVSSKDSRMRRSVSRIRPSSSASAASRSAALGLELLDVRDGLLVLRRFASGLTGPSCSRRRWQALDACGRAPRAARRRAARRAARARGRAAPATSASSRSRSAAESRTC